MPRSIGLVQRLQEATGIHEFVESRFKFQAGLARVIRTVMLNRMRMFSMVSMFSSSFDRKVDAHSAVVQSLREHEPEMARNSTQGTSHS